MNDKEPVEAQSKKQTPRVCAECPEWEKCLWRKREDDGRREFHCSYCGRDVVVTGVAPCRMGIHFCYERLMEILC